MKIDDGETSTEDLFIQTQDSSVKVHKEPIVNNRPTG